MHLPIQKPPIINTYVPGNRSVILKFLGWIVTVALATGTTYFLEHQKLSDMIPRPEPSAIEKILEKEAKVYFFTSFTHLPSGQTVLNNTHYFVRVDGKWVETMPPLQ